MIQSFVRLGAVPLGFQPDHVLTAQVALPPSAYTDLGRRFSFFEALVARVGALPGVEGAALSSGVLGFDGGRSSRLSMAGRGPQIGREAGRGRGEISGGAGSFKKKKREVQKLMVNMERSILVRCPSTISNLARLSCRKYLVNLSSIRRSLCHGS